MVAIDSSVFDAIARCVRDFPTALDKRIAGLNRRLLPCS
jgi:hypothetical protein